VAGKGSDMSKGTVGGGGTTMLRRINVAAVLDAVRRSAPAPLRVAELVERTGLARPTVAQAVDELLDAGWLQQHGPDSADRSLGRPAIRVSLRGRAAPVLGLDVGPHRVTVGVSDLAGRKLSLVRRSGPGWTAQELLVVISEVITEALAEAEVPAEDIAAAVAASPGIVDEHTGRVQLVPSVPGWSAIDLTKHVRSLLDCPVMLDNDANLAALAIAAARGGTGTLLAVQWGERLGAGIVIDGRLHRGTTPRTAAVRWSVQSAQRRSLHSGDRLCSTIRSRGWQSSAGTSWTPPTCSLLRQSATLWLRRLCSRSRGTSPGPWPPQYWSWTRRPW
jgi:DNA-binding Lrp family transcriptional regulator